MLHLRDIVHELTGQEQIKSDGQVVATRGPVVLARIPHAAVGDICEISTSRNRVMARVVAFQEELINLMPFSELDGIAPGATVSNQGSGLSLSFHEHMLGEVIDPLGNKLRAHGSPTINQFCNQKHFSLPIKRSAPAALSRKPISEQLRTGISSIDLFTPIGYGQRVGLFAPAGGGKSTLMGMIARNADVDVRVIALVGERGREVNEFIDDCLGADGLQRSILVVSTSDEPSLTRMLAPYSATTIAEYYRAQGKRVLLLVDSLTRMARATREVGLAAGELPVRQGYTSSVYTELPRLLERAGNDANGSITAIYTVLLNSEDEVDPLGEEVKSLLDGHLMLSSAIADQGIRPAIDVVNSCSRLMGKLCSAEELQHIRLATKVLARLKRDKDVLLLGGSPDAELQTALDLEPRLHALLNQMPLEQRDLTQDRTSLAKIVKSLVESSGSMSEVSVHGVRKCN